MKTSFLLLAFIIAANVYSQIGIGTTTPNASSALDINSTTQGFLPPRMTALQRDEIASPAAGLIIWCSTCGVSGQIQVYNGSDWTNLLGGPPDGIAVGDSYGGGIVAYILQSGDPGYTAGEIHGLIAATGDQSTGAQWGCYGTNIPGADGIALGTGNQNTLDIVNGCTEAGIAARICNDLVSGGYSDWYLPSKDELNMLYLNRIAIGGFTINYYWSSSEYDNNLAWVQFFFNGDQSFNFFKNSSTYVRAVRAF